MTKHEMPAYNILCTGTNATGKTTFVDAWCEKHGYFKMASVSRGVYAKHNKTHKEIWNMTEEERWVLQRDILQTWDKGYKELLAGDRPFICDRDWETLAILK